MENSAHEIKRRRKFSWWLVTLVLVAVILIVRLYDEIGQDQVPEDRFVVARVIDGDTVELAGGDRLRLLSIDTPEKEEPYYESATDFLKRKALGKRARIEFGKKRRDKYGRLLGYLYIDDLFVNKAIIDSGLAYLYLFKDNAGRPEIQTLLQSQRQAMTDSVGLWSQTWTPEPEYLAAGKSYRFHRPSCRFVSRIKLETARHFQGRDKALFIGLSPCRTCRP